MEEQKEEMIGYDGTAELKSPQLTKEERKQRKEIAASNTAHQLRYIAEFKKRHANEISMRSHLRQMKKEEQKD